MMNRALRSLPLLGLLAVVACEDDRSAGAPPGLGAVPVTSPPAIACTAPTSGPTFHKGDVGPNELWRADESPHIVEYDVNVRDGATLTIEPCAEVQLAKKAHIQVAQPLTPNSGTLIAEGAADRPIRFTAKDGERWSSLVVRAPGTMRLAHVTIEGGGGGDFEQEASLVATGDGVDGWDPLVFVDHVTIVRSLGAGAWLQRGSTFIAGSRDLTIRESGSEEHPYPIEIEDATIDALPTGSYTGNRRDEILLEPKGGQTGGTGLLADATLHDRGVPYRVGRSRGTSFIIGGRTDDKLVTLTIEPGVTMKFEKDGSLKVQHFAVTKPSTAALRALGAADRPIVFRSAADAPAPGDWQGIRFNGIPDAANALDHVRVEHAGGDCGCILNTCSSIERHEGAVIFTSPPATAFITNSTFAQSGGHGITQGFDGEFVDFLPTNEFNDLAGCRQTKPRSKVAACESPRPACD
ncbi:MAG: hypothetical protein KIT84_05090 [Labilithrix sp.]|nr:hypothetical protein [Labilithrix sp.]MCW5810362.1 hypothetical protein [Labilithrix sp.]